MNARWRTPKLAAAMMLVLGLILLGASVDGGSRAIAQPANPAIPPEVSAHADQWPQANHDYANTRATTDATINSQNVNQLGVDWSFAIPGSSVFGAAASNPIIAGSTVYFQDLQSNVFAFDLTTGQMLWQKLYNASSIGPNGPALGYGKLFVAKDASDVAALDASTGTELWSTTLTQSPGEGIDIQLSTYDGLVYVSTVPGSGASNFYQGGNVGTLFALDENTGAIVWQFDTVDSANIWGNPQVNSGGGAWYPPAIDVNTGLSYWGIGNPAPFPGTADFPNGSSRPGPNLYTNSLLALNHSDGTLAWYQQVTPHDLYDHDFEASPIIVGSGSSKMVIGAGKSGHVVAFDAATGAVLWDDAVGKHQNDTVQQIPAGLTMEVYPGELGGVETPMAYANGTIFVPVVNLSVMVTNSSTVAKSATDVTRSTGELVAIDAATGIVLWDHAFPIGDFGGATVVNDLVFTSTIDGMVYALDPTTGNVVWQWQAPAGINTMPAVSGDTIIFPAGVGSAPALVALRLGATGSAATPAAATTATATVAATPAPSPAAAATPAASGSPLVLTIASEQDSTFNTSTLTAPANTQVTVQYTNDTAIPHDIHIFAGPDATSPTLAQTNVVTGPGNTQSVTFTTPGPGSYFFRCDVHPLQMTGMLVVTAAGSAGSGP